MSGETSKTGSSPILPYNNPPTVTPSKTGTSEEVLRIKTDTVAAANINPGTPIAQTAPLNKVVTPRNAHKPSTKTLKEDTKFFKWELRFIKIEIFFLKIQERFFGPGTGEDSVKGALTKAYKEYAGYAKSMDAATDKTTPEYQECKAALAKLMDYTTNEFVDKFGLTELIGPEKMIKPGSDAAFSIYMSQLEKSLPRQPAFSESSRILLRFAVDDPKTNKDLTNFINEHKGKMLNFVDLHVLYNIITRPVSDLQNVISQKPEGQPDTAEITAARNKLKALYQPGLDFKHDLEIQSTILFDQEFANANKEIKQTFQRLQNLMGKNFNLPIASKQALLAALKTPPFDFTPMGEQESIQINMLKKFNKVISDFTQKKSEQLSIALKNDPAETLEFGNELSEIFTREISEPYNGHCLEYNNPLPYIQPLNSLSNLMQGISGAFLVTQNITDEMGLVLASEGVLRPAEQRSQLAREQIMQLLPHKLVASEEDLPKKGYVFSQYGFWFKNEFVKEQDAQGITLKWQQKLATPKNDAALLTAETAPVSTDLRFLGTDPELQNLGLTFIKKFCNLEKLNRDKLPAEYNSSVDQDLFDPKLQGHYGELLEQAKAFAGSIDKEFFKGIVQLYE